MECYARENFSVLNDFQMTFFQIFILVVESLLFFQVFIIFLIAEFLLLLESAPFESKVNYTFKK